MKSVNKISPQVYLFLSVTSSLIAMVIYRSTIFRCLFFSTYGESKAALWIIWGVCFVFTYLLTRKHHRNYLSLFSDTVLPFGIYTIMTYENSQPLVVLVVEMAILVLCGSFGIAIIVANKIPDEPRRRLKMLKVGLLRFLNGIRNITAVCLSILVFYLSGLCAFDSPSLIPAVKPTVAVEQNKDEVLKEKMPVISRIDKSIWKTLSFEERLDTVQTIANVENLQVGITHEVRVCAESMGLGVYGQYDSTNHTIYINTELLEDDNPIQCIDTLCHELRHVYQYNVVDAYLALDEEYQQLEIFDDARRYYENLDDYQSASRDGFDAYEKQVVEEDSRKHGKMRSVYYFWLAGKYLADEA